MTTPTVHPRSIDDWISEVNSINAKAGDPSRLRLAAAGEIVSGRFGGLHDFGADTVAVVERLDQDDAIAIRVADDEPDRLRAAAADAAIRLLAH